jgi:hypothetical protein
MAWVTMQAVKNPVPRRIGWWRVKPRHADHRVQRPVAAAVGSHHLSFYRKPQGIASLRSQ